MITYKDVDLTNNKWDVNQYILIGIDTQSGQNSMIH